MSLKFGTNTISTSGNYAKFGTNNLSYVKFGSTTVWTKSTSTTYTVTLSKSSGALGSWNKSSITGVASGASISYSIGSDGKATLTVGSQTAIFTPTYNDEFDNYFVDYLNNASGSVTANRTVTAYTTLNPNIKEWTGVVDLDHIYNTSDSMYIGNYSKVKLYCYIYGFNPYTQEEYDGFDDEIVIDNGYAGPYYDDFEQDGYGVIGISINAISPTVDPSVSIGSEGSNGVTIFEVYMIRGV